ncbi:YrhK family protein [Streptacidiphilus pinicola]|nr:YrhK family protein [Streptacidiphilus pinicola]
MTARDTTRRPGRWAAATFVEHVGSDGVVVRRGSRRHRKHQMPPTGSTWWAPTARGWWIAVLFAVGSLLFAMGSIPGYADAVGARGDTVTYFVGSLFFTSASLLSYREVVDASSTAQNPHGRRFLVYQPRRIDWWATAVQLVGTIYFNISTGIAMADNLSAETAHQHVWRPDAIGSLCFLVSSALAWYEVCHGWLAWRPRVWSWWITLTNLIGSVAFGVSAVAGFVNPVTGQVKNADGADTQTLIGSICFFVGAVLLFPERTEKAPP